MSFTDWMLALHVLAAFSLVAGTILFWGLIVVGRRTDTPADTLRLGPLAKVGTAAVGIGLGGTIILGVYLAFAVDGYAIWDLWIIAGVVLWFLGAGLGRRTGEAFLEGPKKALELQEAGQRGSNAELLALNRTSKGLRFQALTSVVVLLIIIDMIWKPGA